LGHAHGIEGKLKSGTVKLGEKEDAGQFVFDMQSFDADTDISRKKAGLEGQTDAATRTKVNENMRGPNVLDVKEHPTATFDIESSLATGKQSEDDHPLYELKGRFTLHGIANPLTITVEAKTKDNSTQLNGKFKILQTDFGIKPYSTGLGAIRVADELTIWGEIQLNPPE
jgi:polyisoprenoid-binding protein YceI